MRCDLLKILREKPELQKAAEKVLEHGETLSAFIESSLRINIEKRLKQKEFIARGLASRELDRKSGDYVDAASVLEELQDMLDIAKKQPS